MPRRSPRSILALLTALPLVVAAVLIYLAYRETPIQAATLAAPFTEPNSSSPIAINTTNTRLVVANAEKNSVSIVDISNPAINPAKLVEIPVGREPRSVSILPTDDFAYVSNQADGTVSVISLANNTVIKTITVGTEPYGTAVHPDGSKVYVANEASNTISVINTASNTVVRTIDVSAQIQHPRGLAVTAGASPTLYVTQFLSYVKANPATDQMKDDGKVGKVLAINATTDLTGGVGVLQPITSGFTSTANLSGTFTFPNQMQSILISGTKAYLPNVGASPQRPPVFDSSTQALVSVLDLTAPLAPTDPNLSINTNKAVAEQTAGNKLFYAVPWAIAMEPNKQRAWVASLAAENIFALSFNAAGAPSVVIISDTVTPTLTRTLEIPMTTSGARSPTGIVIRKDLANPLAYVVNEVSRSLTTIDLAVAPIPTIKHTLQLSSMPVPGSAEDKANVGKELFNSAIGRFDQINPSTGQPVIGRLSRAGWQSCVSCHPGGLTDAVVWQFAAGPRKTIAMDSTFNPKNPADQRSLNYSAQNDEVADFENNTRNVSGGAGTIISSTTPLDLTPFAPTTPLAAPNITKPQLTVRGFKAQEAITEYFSNPQFGIRTPNAPIDILNQANIIEGGKVFAVAGCQSCHGGGKWSNSSVASFVWPAGANRVFTDTAQAGVPFLKDQLVNVGTFGTGVAELAANGNTALGGPNGALVNGTTANGNGAGFNIPSLLGIAQTPPYFHNGVCETLECVLSDTFAAHRDSGSPYANGLLGGSGSVATTNRANLIQYLKAIDEKMATPVFINTPVISVQRNNGW